MLKRRMLRADAGIATSDDTAALTDEPCWSTVVAVGTDVVALFRTFVAVEVGAVCDGDGSRDTSCESDIELETASDGDDDRLSAEAELSAEILADTWVEEDDGVLLFETPLFCVWETSAEEVSDTSAVSKGVEIDVEWGELEAEYDPCEGVPDPLSTWQ
jgi:hypothetical protein